LLETVCKRVLDETGTEYDEKADLPALYRAVAKHLNIAPSSTRLTYSDASWAAPRAL
jgi:hypothetical protein